MALLSASDLTIVVEGRALVEELSLSLEPGEVVALTGPSGAGKTTTLRALAGLIPAAGAIELEGREPDDWGWPRYRRRVGFVAQRPVVIDGTVADNLALAFAVKSAEGATFDETEAERLLEALRLGREVMERRARSLSEGERQRVALARTLLTVPPVLLLDEPSSALDEEATEAVEDLLRERVRDGGTALLVSHDAAQRRRLATRAIAVAPREPREPRNG